MGKKRLKEEILLEKTRAELLNKSKHADNYVDTSKGRNRYERRLKSKVANNVYQYNKIDMNDFFKKDILTIGIDVKGETNNYIVTMKFQGVLKEIQNEVKSNNNKLEFKVITRSMSRVYNGGDVKLWCTCPDWRYRQSFWASKGGYATQIELRPSDITNPHDSKGGGCKHSLLVMSNLDWMMKVSSVIFNYIKYSQKNLQTNYANYIFPKIYGMPYNKALQLDLFDSGLLPSDQETLTKIASTNLKNKDEKGRFIKGNEFRFKGIKSKEDNKEDDTYFNLEKDRKGRNVLTYPIDKNRNNLGRFIKGNQASKKPTSIKQTFGDEKKKQIVPNKEEEGK